VQVLQDLFLYFIACFILLVIVPLVHISRRLQWQVRGGLECTRQAEVAPYERFSSYYINMM